jgi:hypothetical protein
MSAPERRDEESEVNGHMFQAVLDAWNQASRDVTPPKPPRGKVTMTDILITSYQPGG